MAKKKSIFNDRQTEIDELTTIIKTDLKSLNNQIGKLQDLGKSQREFFGSSQSRHIASHSSSIVMTLQSKLANMSNHFKSVLEVRSEVCIYVCELKELEATHVHTYVYTYLLAFCILLLMGLHS